VENPYSVGFSRPLRVGDQGREETKHDLTDKRATIYH
jgi:hypothetical protein